MSRRTMQRMEFYRLRGNSLAEIAVVGQRHHGVPVMFRRQGVEQVDHAVFHATGVEAVDDMHDVCGHRPSTLSSAPPIAGLMSAAKRARVAAADSNSDSSNAVAINTA